MTNPFSREDEPPFTLDDAAVKRAANAFWRPADGEWEVPPLLLRNMRRALEAALDPSYRVRNTEDNW